MLTERDEERLIDYALGEVEAEERHKLSKYLAENPEGEAAETAEDYQALAVLAGRALQQERSAANNGQLSPAQRAKLLREMNRPEEKMLPWARVARMTLSAAAVFLVVGFLGWMAMRQHVKDTQAKLETVEIWQRIDHLTPGVERLLITDINNAATSVSPLRNLDLSTPEKRQEARIYLDEVESRDVARRKLSEFDAMQAPSAAPVPAFMDKENLAGNRPFVEQRTRIVESEVLPSVSTLGSELSDPQVAAGAVSTNSYAHLVPPSAAPASPPVALGQQLQALGYLGESRSAGRRFYADFDGDGVINEGLSLHHMPSPGGEQYNAAPESAFQPVGQQPLSTFSIDVDTAGYSNVRRMLTQGQWPPAEAVRIEEMLNYFDYSYPQPTTADPFSVNVEMARCPWAPEHFITKIGVQGREIVQNDRPAANLVFLIDCSGSMEPANKLPLVRESMKALFAGLDARDRVGIVTYAGDARIALPSTSCDARETIIGAIDSLNAGGSTNGQAGIQQAYDMAAANFISGGVNRVILATDGDFNVGVTDAGSLLEMIAQRAKGKIFLTALGFGMGNLKDGRLEELADKGNGNYAYIDTFAEARKALGEDLQGTLVTIAKDVKIQVEFNPARVQAYRLIGYDNRLMAAQDFNNDQKDAGEVGAGHTVTALYEIVPIGAPVQAGVDALKYQTPAQPVAPLPTEPGTGEWMNVKLRYKQPEGDTSTKIEVPVTSEPSAIESATSDMKLASGVAAFGMVLRNSQHRGTADLNMAQQLAEASIVQAYGGGDPHVVERLAEPRRELIDLIVRAKTLR